ncbi:hypothetical protein EVAR_54176_1 [Eumeta japonica]|uniref:Uncharacterized protein n=1 Tax=Eumeta variegata TaxID=151549 RepID=A0A4C1Y000_EUMVA|nr:hypothetical protein EVAR_54176_1 [Eumeta japonica]
MDRTILDTETLLSENEHWTKLTEEWGPPVDLETEDGPSPDTGLPSLPGTLNLKRQTFDSAVFLKSLKKKIYNGSSKKPVLEENYEQFLHDLERRCPRENHEKSFYFVGGQIISAVSVDEICEDIDNVFKSVEKLCSATSTLRPKTKNRLPKTVECSISATDLSFDDTSDELEKDTVADEAVARYIDEMFDALNNTISVLQTSGSSNNSSGRTDRNVSVTALVQRFSSFLDNPVLKCGPRGRRQCCEKFKELAEFWKINL